MSQLLDVKKARIALRRAIDVACIARGEAQWTNGYRAGSGDKDSTLYTKEQWQWKACAATEARAERAMAAFARAIRRER